MRDSQNQIFLAHSGKVGGGRKGIGKLGFLNFYQGTLESVRWPDGRETELIPIGQIDDKHLPEQIAHFVYEVRQFKEGTSSQKGRLSPILLPHSFRPEFSGQRKGYKTSGTIISWCDHGLIISALAAELEKRKLKYGNDHPRDLYIVSDDGAIKVLFEAKTDVATSSVYGAVGQLMLHGAAESVAIERVLVLPQAPKPETRSALAKLGIKVLTYARRKKGFSFRNLPSVLPL